MNTLSHVYSYSNAGMLDILALLYIVNAYVSNKQYLTDNGAGTQVLVLQLHTTAIL